MSADKYQPTQDQFDNDVAGGKMELLSDDGLYRHLRFHLDGGGFRWFDIVTWPNRLVITGDCETFVFTRLTDMFEFFRSGGARINPSYWQEKIIDGRERAQRFEWDTFRAAALAEFEGATAAMNPFHRLQARDELVDALYSDSDEFGAVDVLRNFSYQEGGPGSKCLFRFDLSEGSPDGKIWDYHYIWCCRAIVWAIAQYDIEKGGAA